MLSRRWSRRTWVLRGSLHREACLHHTFHTSAKEPPYPPCPQGKRFGSAKVVSDQAHHRNLWSRQNLPASHTVFPVVQGDEDADRLLHRDLSHTAFPHNLDHIDYQFCPPEHNGYPPASCTALPHHAGDQGYQLPPQQHGRNLRTTVLHDMDDQYVDPLLPCHARVQIQQQTQDLQTGRLSKTLLKLPRYTSVLPSLEQWAADGHPLQKNTVIVALTNLKRDGRYKQASEVAEYVWKERVYVMDDVDHMYRLYLMGQTAAIKDVETCFASIPLKWLTEKVYNQLISIYIARDMLPQAKKTLEKLKKSGNYVSALPYNQFMAIYRHQRQANKALELIKDMVASNVSPDTRTYNLLLSTINKQNDVDGVLKNFKAMKDAGIIPDIVTYSLVAKAYIAAGQMQEAESLAVEMRKCTSKNGHLAHDLLLAVYAEQGKCEDVKRVWKDLQGIKGLSARSYGVMIESLGKLGLVQEAEKVAAKAERVKQKLPTRVYNALMDAYGRHGMLEAAEDLMVRIRRSGSKPNSVTYRSLIAGYLKVGQLDRAMKYLRISKESLKHDYSKPFFEAFLLILDHLAKKGESDASERAFRYFTTPDGYRNTEAYNALLKAHVNAKTLVPNFLQRMSTDGIQPDAKTLALVAEMEATSQHQY